MENFILLSSGRYNALRLFCKGKNFYLERIVSSALKWEHD